MEYIQAHWVQIGVVALAVHTALKSIAVAIDKDPNTENKFEKIVNFFGNILGYLFGKRK